MTQMIECFYETQSNRAVQMPAQKHADVDGKLFWRGVAYFNLGFWIMKAATAMFFRQKLAMKEVYALLLSDAAGMTYFVVS